MRILRLIPLVLVLAVVVGGWFLQTPAGFDRVLRPLAARAGVEVEAERGRLSWAGALELDEARIHGQGGLAVRVERLAVDVGVLSLLPGRRLEVESLEARGVAVAIEPAAPEDADDEPDIGTDLAAAELEDPYLPVLPVLRPDVVVEDLTITLHDEDGALEIGPVSASFHCRGEEERCPLTAHVPIRRPDGTGALALEGQVEATAGPDATGDRFTARLTIDDEPSALHFVADLEGTASALAIAFDPSRWTLSGPDLEAAGTFEGQLEAATHRSRSVVTLERAPLPADRLPAGLRAVFAEAAASGEVTIALLGPTLKADADLAVAPLVVAEGPRAIDLSAVLSITRGDPVALESAVAELVGDSDGFGRAEAKGAPLTEEGLAFELAGLRLAPWLGTLGATVPESDRAVALRGEGSVHATRGGLAGTGSLVAEGGAAGALTLEAELDAPAAGQWRFEASLDGAGGAAGRATARRSPDAGIEADLRLADWDLTPWRYLWERPDPPDGEASEGPEEAPAADAASEPSETASAATAEAEPGPDLRAHALGERLRLVDLEVTRAELDVTRERGATRIVLQPSQLLDGTAQWRSEARTHGGQPTVEWEARGEELELGKLWPALGIEDGALTGRLSFETHGYGAGPEPLDHADGAFSFTLRDGAAEGTPLQSQVVSALDMTEFSVLEVERARGDWEIVDGTALVDDLRIGSDALHLMLTGEITRRGLDLRANPRLGPGLATGVEGRFATALLGTVDGVLALPLIATFRGDWGALESGVRPAAPSTLNSLFGGLTDLAGQAGEAAGVIRSESP